MLRLEPTLQRAISAIAQQHEQLPALQEWSESWQSRYVAQIDSTNSALMQNMPPHASLLCAGHQTAGRGRGNKVWVSPHHSLTFSIALPFFNQARQNPATALVVGVACAEVLQKLGAQVQLKWPNDILWQGKKLAGILLESSTRHPHHCVLGIGVNLESPQIEGGIGLSDIGLNDIGLNDIGLNDFDQNAPSLNNLCAQSDDARELLLALIPTLLCNLAQLDAHGFTPFIARWNELHAFAHQTVSVRTAQNQIIEGGAQGVDHLGRLLIVTPTQTHALSVAKYHSKV